MSPGDPEYCERVSSVSTAETSDDGRKENNIKTDNKIIRRI
jgi:hypothetical protein